MCSPPSPVGDFQGSSGTSQGRGAESTLGPSTADAAATGAAAYGLRFCREADSVLEGFLCSEPTVVSDACRRADRGFDQFVCDDVKMQKLQKGILEQTWWAVRAMITQLLRRFGP
jgi:hypothetical protein